MGRRAGYFLLRSKYVVSMGRHMLEMEAVSFAATWVSADAGSSSWAGPQAREGRFKVAFVEEGRKMDLVMAALALNHASCLCPCTSLAFQPEEDVPSCM